MAKLVTWSQYRSSIGDRSGLFAALAEAWPIERALYPGSYVDLAPSTAVPSVTYVDTDQRAAKFFSAQDRVRDELTGRTRPGAGREVRFLQADYTQPLAVPAGSMDMLISLYAGPVWENCRQYLRTGAWLLANTSHGDASLAALEPSVRLVAAVHDRDGCYRLVTDRLEQYLVPRNIERANPETIRSTGCGVAYTQPAFAYVFQIC